MLDIALLPRRFALLPAAPHQVGDEIIDPHAVAMRGTDDFRGKIGLALAQLLHAERGGRFGARDGAPVPTAHSFQ